MLTQSLVLLIYMYLDSYYGLYTYTYSVVLTALGHLASLKLSYACVLPIISPICSATFLRDGEFEHQSFNVGDSKERRRFTNPKRSYPKELTHTQ